MNPFDNPATIPTLSAFGGSVIGALSSTLSAWIGQRQRERRELVANKVSQLEQLYSDFINESARLLVDAVQHSLEDPSTLVPIYALISRIRLRSSTEVIESGERLIATILKVYSKPNLTPEENSVGGEQAQRSPVGIQQCVPARTRIIREESLTTSGRLRPRPPFNRQQLRANLEIQTERQEQAAREYESRYGVAPCVPASLGQWGWPDLSSSTIPSLGVVGINRRLARRRQAVE